MNGPAADPGTGIGYDVATVLWQGARPYQEDTLLADFHGGMDRGFAVLADGMGGHAAGDLASRLVVIDAASHLKFLMHDGAALEATLAAELVSAIETANGVLKERASGDPRLHGMGTTFLATVLFEDRLYWASVGDSPLYLWREGELRQLNADHSMAPVIDQMARSGEITPAEAAAHPDRNALTSVLMGTALKAMDVPETAIVLDPGDVLVQASDGVQALDQEKISAVLEAGGNSRHIADALMAALKELNDPGQDNTAILVLQLTQAERVARREAAPVSSSATERAVGSTLAADTATPRAPTPRDVARTAGARRWGVPAGLLGSAAVAAGVMFGVPGLLSGPDSVPLEVASVDTSAAEGATSATGPFETAALAPQVVPQPVLPLAPAAAPAAGPTAAPTAAPTTITRSLSPAPDAGSSADVHELMAATAEASGTGLSVLPTEEGSDKLASAYLRDSPLQGSGATIEFGTSGTGSAPAPGAGAIGNAAVAPQDDASQPGDAEQPDGG